MKIIRDGKEYALTNEELREARDEMQRTYYIWEIDDYIADTVWSFLTEKIPEEEARGFRDLIEQMADECMVREVYNDSFYCSIEYIHDLVDEELGEFLEDIGLKFEEE